jgi:GGDEF domain-containing protein
MGNRAYIQIDSKRLQTPIIFYGHWSGDDNLRAVKNVLARTTRIGDPTYLAAQIFYEFATVLGNYDGELSFGIDTGHLAGGEVADEPSVYVDADNGAYCIGDNVYTEFVQRPHVLGF